MNWISELFKNITVSKTLTSACFLTGLTLLVLPSYLPDMFGQLPKILATVVLAITVFTGCLVFFWGGNLLKVVLFAFFSLKVQESRAKKLSNAEIELISFLGTYADKSFDLRGFNYDEANFTKLEILARCNTLKDKGLLCINPYNENIIFLSESGRKKALKLQKEEQEKNQSNH
ncbi:hypothetical protein [Photobacterium damselae]|uniref:hypothetical protein n=1 Tax=Photobacterium damselae TaxID=38293 RepID=UPI001EFD0CC5|nr:hypothetical protein [Photobacterium damselae]MCG9704014.1 hypothetical protein [Photobacterium damselae]